MSREGAPATGSADARELRVAVVATRWHETVTEGLLDGARRALADAGGSADEMRVPGAFELPVVAARLAASGYDAVVALGVVVRGGTPHFEYVCSAATHGLLRVAVDHQVAIGFGVLTCDTAEQAYDRAGLHGSREDKGYEAAQAALDTALLLRD